MIFPIDNVGPIHYGPLTYDSTAGVTEAALLVNDDKNSRMVVTSMFISNYSNNPVLVEMWQNPSFGTGLTNLVFRETIAAYSTYWRVHEAIFILNGNEDLTIKAGTASVIYPRLCGYHYTLQL